MTIHLTIQTRHEGPPPCLPPDPRQLVHQSDVPTLPPLAVTPTCLHHQFSGHELGSDVQCWALVSNAVLSITHWPRSPRQVTSPAERQIPGQ